MENKKIGGIGNKRGIIRILEAAVAILVIAGVLLVAYSKNQEARSNDFNEHITNLQEKILNDISINNELRDNALQSTNVSLHPNLAGYVSSRVPSDLGHVLRVCDLTDPPTPCKMTAEEFIDAKDSEIFVEEVIISAHLGEYDPKKVRLFVWEK